MRIHLHLHPSSLLFLSLVLMFLRNSYSFVHMSTSTLIRSTRPPLSSMSTSTFSTSTPLPSSPLSSLQPLPPPPTQTSTQQPPPLQPLKLNIQTLPPNELTTLIKNLGYPAYRADQITNWVRVRGVTDVRKMVNLPGVLRDKLDVVFGCDDGDGDFEGGLIGDTAAAAAAAGVVEDDSEYGNDGDDDSNDVKHKQSLQPLLRALKPSNNAALRVLTSQTCKKDGTIKRSYALHDMRVIESVLMVYNSKPKLTLGSNDVNKSGLKERTTACISSQSGCAMACVFCATGQMGFGRQLTSCEIFEQVSIFDVHLRRHQLSSNQKNVGLSNVVFMGMGEPLLNYRNVVTAIKRINSELSIGWRSITVSTVGIPQGIRKLTDDDSIGQINLAVSLHEFNNDERSAIIPANKRFGGIEELMSSIRYYIEKRGRRVTFECALIKGVNDTVEKAHELGTLLRTANLKKSMCHVNVIPLNPTSGYSKGQKSNNLSVSRFCNVLIEEYGVSCTARIRKGIDIDGGCGQLAGDVEKGLGIFGRKKGEGDDENLQL